VLIFFCICDLLSSLIHDTCAYKEVSVCNKRGYDINGKKRLVLIVFSWNFIK